MEAMTELLGRWCAWIDGNRRLKGRPEVKQLRNSAALALQGLHINPRGLMRECLAILEYNGTEEELTSDFIEFLTADLPGRSNW